MKFKAAVITVFQLIVILIVLVNIYMYMYYYGSTGKCKDQLKIYRTSHITQINDIVMEPLGSESVITRNKLSRQMNQMSKMIGQLQCEKSPSRTNDQGGWCKELSKESFGEHKTDHKIAVALSNFLKGKRVVNFGDGPGIYEREILKLKEVTSYDAFDGAPFCEETSEGRVQFMDLTVPQYGIPLYDWVISLEVAEHIPSKYESIYLDNLFRHANEGIILSWAVPGQNGMSHINTRPLSYVIKVMSENGFERDETSSTRFKKAASQWWLEQNINVYLRKSYSKFQNETILAKWYA